MAILLTTDNDSCYIEATNIPIAYVSNGVNGYYKSAFGNYPSFGVALIFDAPTTVTVHNPSASTLSTTQFGNYYLCAYTINWFTHNSYTSLVEEAPYFDNETDFRAWVFTNTPPPVVYNSGGAGSGYIGNSLVSNKKMVGYNVPTSSAESTKTESVNEASATPVSGKPKSGNGFARIKFLNPLYTLLTATYVDDKIAESKWGDKVRYAEWANLQSGGRMTCSFDGQNNFIGFNDSSPSYYGYHDAMNMIQSFSKGNYKYLIFKTDVVFEYSSEYEGIIIVRDDYIANSSTKIGTLMTSPIQKTVPYNQESIVIINISSLNDTIYIYLITHKVKRFKIKEMYLG